MSLVLLGATTKKVYRSRTKTRVPFINLSSCPPHRILSKFLNNGAGLGSTCASQKHIKRKFTTFFLCAPASIIVGHDFDIWRTRPTVLYLCDFYLRFRATGFVFSLLTSQNHRYQDALLQIASALNSNFCFVYSGTERLFDNSTVFYCSRDRYCFQLSNHAVSTGNFEYLMPLVCSRILRN